MVGKNNQYIQKIKQGTKVETYSIKKFKVGIASVAIGCSVFFGAGVAMAGDQISGEQAVSETTISKDTPKTESKPDTETVTEKQTTTTKVENNVTQSQPNAISKEKETEKPKDVVNTKKLEDLLSEIDKLNLSNYTEESAKVLQEKVAKAKEVLTNATSQKEIDSAYNALVSYKNSGLKHVPKLEENNTPKPNTTNGKETVGKKAENTEPNGENIAGHNHSLNGTTLPEGSGFRTENTNGLSIEVEGDTTFRPGDYLNYNSKYVHMKLKYDKSKYGENPRFAITGTPNVGVQFEASNQSRDKKNYYNRAEGYISGYLRGTIPNEMIGKYNMLIHMKYNANGVTTTLKFPIEVKPNTPTLKKPEENDGNKYSSLAATTLVGNHSEVKFEVNGQESPWIKASNGEAIYRIEQGFRPGDRVRVKAKAYSDTISVGEHRDKLSPEESESDWSSVTTLPDFPAPTLNKDRAKTEVEQAYSTRFSNIDNDNSLTNEEKTEVKGLAETAKNDAIRNIDGAQDETTLNEAKNNGITNIGNVTLPRKAKKAEAIEAVEAVKTTKDTEIDGNNDLTTEEKTEVKKKTAKAKEDAVNAIKAATTNAQVGTEKEAGVNAVKGVTLPAETEKAKAIKAVEAVKTTKDTEIDGNNDLTTEEKTEVKKKTEKAKEDAVNAIKAATTNAQVGTEKGKGITAINGVALPAEPEKAKAITEIKAALEAKEKATDEDKSLTKGQKTSIKEIAKKEAMAATVKIKEATTNKEVEEAKNEGIEKIKAAYAKNAELAAELTLPKLIITKWEDEEGNELRPADAKAPAEPGGANEALAHGEIVGYEFVATRDAGEVVTHIFRKLPKKSPIIEERQLPVVEKVNTKTVLPNTGANTTNTGLAGLGLSVLGAVLMTARQRRKNK